MKQEHHVSRTSCIKDIMYQEHHVSRTSCIKNIFQTMKQEHHVSRTSCIKNIMYQEHHVSRTSGKHTKLLRELCRKSMNFDDEYRQPSLDRRLKLSRNIARELCGKSKNFEDEFSQTSLGRRRKSSSHVTMEPLRSIDRELCGKSMNFEDEFSQTSLDKTLKSSLDFTLNRSRSIDRELCGKSKNFEDEFSLASLDRRLKSSRDLTLKPSRSIDSSVSTCLESLEDIISHRKKILLKIAEKQEELNSRATKSSGVQLTGAVLLGVSFFAATFIGGAPLSLPAAGPTLLAGSHVVNVIFSEGYKAKIAELLKEDETKLKRLQTLLEVHREALTRGENVKQYQIDYWKISGLFEQTYIHNFVQLVRIDGFIVAFFTVIFTGGLDELSSTLSKITKTLEQHLSELQRIRGIFKDSPLISCH